MAPQPAVIGNSIRLNNFRLGYLPADLARERESHVRILIAGQPARVRIDGLSITDAINDAPNSCSLVIESPAPTAGQTVRVTINSNAPRLLFNGILQQDDLTYQGRSMQLAHPSRAIDDTVALTRRRPFGTWVDVSATTIAQTIIAAYAPSFTATHVQAGLPLLSIIFDGTDDFAVALKRIATAIGGYWYVEDGDVHLFTSDASDLPDPIRVGYPFCDDPPIRATRDISQLRTRQFGKGHGETVLIDLAAGATILPLEDAAMFNPAGGKAIAGTTPDGAQSQIITYTGTITPGAGSTVGPSLSPSVPPSPTPVDGVAGLGIGIYGAAYTFVTALGETLPSPIAYFTTRGAMVVPGPTVAPFLQNIDTGIGYSRLGWAPGQIVEVVYTYSLLTDASLFTNDTAQSPASTTVLTANSTFPSDYNALYVTVYHSPDPHVKRLHVFLRNVTLGAPFEQWLGFATVANAPGASSRNNIWDVGSNNIVPPTPNANVPAQQQAAVAGIAQGPSGTTARNYYRTTVGGSQLKLQQTIADNSTTTGVQDATADGSLGANAPTTNTSGLGSTGGNTSGFYTDPPVTFATDGAATLATTSAPLFTAGTYVFVAADVGARLYIKSGTNWTPGFYTIVSVSGGAARLDRACATVASPTFGRYGVDYSALTNPRVTFGDLVIDATTPTKFTSVGFPVGPHYIGNVVSVSNGVGFIAQQAIVVSVAGTVATCDRILGTVGSTGGRAVLGGAPATPYVYAGSPTLITGSAGPFPPGGGWVKLGDQLVRYTGISGNTLTGIPPIGTTGALLNTVAYGDPIALVPALTGVTGLALAMQRGTPVHIWVERNDLAAQNEQAAIDAANGRVPADGIYEGPIIVDERRGEVSLSALCDTALRLFSRPIWTVVYATRDVKTKSGKPVTVDLVNPPIHQALTIQDVTITEINSSPAMGPKFTVTASTWRTSLEELLRRMMNTLEAQ